MSQIKQESSSGSYWRSFSDRENGPEFRKFLFNEFQKGASVLEDGITRRSFLKLMGASAALAGVAGCSIRKPVQKLRPYAKRPEDYIPGKPVYYATAMQVGSDVVGVLAESQEGRPTKLEGNPAHSMSLGGMKSYHQAAVLDLYDPDRIFHPMSNGEKSDWGHYETWLTGQLSSMSATRGEGACLLVDSQVSPTFSRLLLELKNAYPALRVFKYDGLNSDCQAEGIQLATGRAMVPQYQFQKADIIVSFGADFLGVEPNNISYTRDFSERRDPDSGQMNRLYAFENHLTITGSKADHRIRVKASQIEPAAWVVASALIRQVGPGSLSASIVNAIHGAADHYRSLVDDKIVQAIVSDLVSHRGRSLIVSGIQCAPTVHALVYALNQILGNASQTVIYRAADTSEESLRHLSDLLSKGSVKHLFIVGGNPVYNAPVSLKFSERLKKASSIVHLTHAENETSQLAQWVLPCSHFLESWGDLKAIDGSVSIVQPLIQPLYNSRSSAEFLSGLLGKADMSYNLVRSTWKATEAAWKKWLHNGVVSGASTALPAAPLTDKGFSESLAKQIRSLKTASGIEIVFPLSYSLLDGRYANNGWLQELPDPITKLVWDNAALISEKTAEKLSLKTEDLILITHDGHELKVPVMVMPGQADESISVSLGYGRKVVGRVGKGTGSNGYALWTGAAFISGAKIEKTGRVYHLATTQNHGSMEGRAIIREATLDTYKKHPNFAKEMIHTPPLESLWEERVYDKGYQWGMSIDLSRCTGCSACITACQSENNIPIVGKKQAMNGRVMHWIRLDRYFEGDVDQARVAYQPVTCLHCENAPCEQVCPVAATVHSEEGLNDMVYNRCVGTRYCSNNCPVKVRRFNFFDYHQRNPQSVKKERKHLFDYVRQPDLDIQKQFNPDVTVRMRGVMEKCTYCVQRINEARINSKLEEVQIVDGDVVTACQQSCPAGAIVFGNILDPNSKVSKAKARSREYHLLEELHLKPRTTYLASIRNPHPSLVSVVEAAHHE